MSETGVSLPWWDGDQHKLAPIFATCLDAGYYPRRVPFCGMPGNWIRHMDNGSGNSSVINRGLCIGPAGSSLLLLLAES
jgi:hypothetical protein